MTKTSGVSYALFQRDREERVGKDEQVYTCGNPECHNTFAGLRFTKEDPKTGEQRPHCSAACLGVDVEKLAPPHKVPKQLPLATPSFTSRQVKAMPFRRF